MKTFRLVALTILNDDELQVSKQGISLLDGLIINKEDGENRWLLDILIVPDYLHLFNELHKQSQTKSIPIQTVISKKDNDPATMSVKVKKITTMGDSVSVLMDGVLINRRTKRAEILLTDLLQRGLHGEQLLQEFKQQLNNNSR
ncbi:YwpF-like family protein [Cytobacillus sp. Hm23]|uniref:YwpF-like family protein n=1 Tax=Cytobacillus sp. IB215665 TaxID=3097357 RepID=UPI002A15EC4E|nr:YwpF-like family protein [Cytobacillus sp. IB215665]MDX8363733.1 YwpF-like family protein [Cytobacillus sp. IB215665]